LDQPKTLSLDRITLRKGSSGLTAEAERSEHCLDVFVYGEENTAVADLFAVAQIRNLAKWSPVFLYGPHQSGKTSLAASLAARYARALNVKTVVHCDGGDFARSLVAAIESDDMDRFRKRHRQCGLLIVDGLQGMQSKSAAQEELVAVLDERRRADLPTILTSPTLANSIRGLKSSLVSRCLGGLSVEVAFPGNLARSRVLTLLAKKLNIEFQSRDMEEMAKRFKEPISVPELQGLLLKWWHHHSQERKADSDDEQTLDRLIDDRHQSKIPDVADIAKRVAKECNLKQAELRGSTRRSRVVRARSLAMYLARELTPLSFQQIGEYFGRRDHTTVMHACRKLATDIGVDRELQRIAEEVKRQLK
jgi:chromosomal replication initiator protein